MEMYRPISTSSNQLRPDQIATAAMQDVATTRTPLGARMPTLLQRCLDVTIAPPIRGIIDKADPVPDARDEHIINLGSWFENIQVVLPSDVLSEKMRERYYSVLVSLSYNQWSAILNGFKARDVDRRQIMLILRQISVEHIARSEDVIKEYVTFCKKNPGQHEEFPHLIAMQEMLSAGLAISELAIRKGLPKNVSLDTDHSSYHREFDCEGFVELSRKEVVTQLSLLSKAELQLIVENCSFKGLLCLITTAKADSAQSELASRLEEGLYNKLLAAQETVRKVASGVLGRCMPAGSATNTSFFGSILRISPLEHRKNSVRTALSENICKLENLSLEDQLLVLLDIIENSIAKRRYGACYGYSSVLEIFQCLDIDVDRFGKHFKDNG